jgi:hypothetical protein
LQDIDQKDQDESSLRHTVFRIHELAVHLVYNREEIARNLPSHQSEVSYSESCNPYSEYRMVRSSPMAEVKFYFSMRKGIVPLRRQKIYANTDRTDRQHSSPFCID